MKTHKNEIRTDYTQKMDTLNKVPVNKISLSDWIFNTKNTKSGKYE